MELVNSKYGEGVSALHVFISQCTECTLMKFGNVE